MHVYKIVYVKCGWITALSGDRPEADGIFKACLSSYSLSMLRLTVLTFHTSKYEYTHTYTHSHTHTHTYFLDDRAGPTS